MVSTKLLQPSRGTAPAQEIPAHDASYFAALRSAMRAAYRMLPIGRRRKTVQFWLGWQVVSCILPAALAAAFLLVHSYERERASLETSTMATTRALSRLVEQDLVGATAALQVLARSARLASGDLAGFHARARDALLEQVGNGIVLVDPTGQQIMSTFVPYGQTLPHTVSGLMSVISESARPSISDFYIGATSGVSQVAVGVPVLRDGKVVYGLTMGITSERLGGMLRDQHLPPDWIVSVLDRQGTIVARTRAPDRFVGQKGATDLLRRMTEIPEGVIEADTREGVPVLASFSRSALSGWTIAIGVPTASLTADLRRALWLNAAAAALLLAMGIVSSRIISRRITRPIHALTSAAAALGSDRMLSISRSDIAEVDGLGQVLVKADHLLEQRERERNRAERERRTANEQLLQKSAEHASAEQALAQSEAEFRAGFEGAAIGKMLADPVSRRILRVNRAFARMLGYEPEELVGRTSSEFTWPEDRALAATEYARLLSGEVDTQIREKRYVRRDGAPFWVRVSAALVRVPESSHPTLAITAIEDIDARYKAEAELRMAKLDLERVVDERTSALAQRDLLLREVYHRVKNNLQIVDSLLVMQSSQLRDADDRQNLLALRGRIYALGLVHHQLMGSADLKTFDVGPFLHKLSENILEGGAANGIRLSVESCPMNVGLDFAIPLGLLVTELVTNSLKHAFPAGVGNISVVLRPDTDGKVVLIVSDDGRGHSGGDTSEGDKFGLGTRLIRGLVAQLEGTMIVTSNNGMTTEIRTAMAVRS